MTNTNDCENRKNKKIVSLSAYKSTKCSKGSPSLEKNNLENKALSNKALDNIISINKITTDKQKIIIEYQKNLDLFFKELYPQKNNLAFELNNFYSMLKKYDGDHTKDAPIFKELLNILEDYVSIFDTFKMLSKLSSFFDDKKTLKFLNNTELIDISAFSEYQICIDSFKTTVLKIATSKINSETITEYINLYCLIDSLKFVCGKFIYAYSSISNMQTSKKITNLKDQESFSKDISKIILEEESTHYINHKKVSLSDFTKLLNVSDSKTRKELIEHHLDKITNRFTFEKLATNYISILTSEINLAAEYEYESFHKKLECEKIIDSKAYIDICSLIKSKNYINEDYFKLRKEQLNIDILSIYDIGYPISLKNEDQNYFLSLDKYNILYTSKIHELFETFKMFGLEYVKSFRKLFFSSKSSKIIKDPKDFSIEALITKVAGLIYEDISQDEFNYLEYDYEYMSHSKDIFIETHILYFYLYKIRNTNEFNEQMYFKLHLLEKFSNSLFNYCIIYDLQNWTIEKILYDKRTFLDLNILSKKYIELLKDYYPNLSINKEYYKKIFLLNESLYVPFKPAEQIIKFASSYKIAKNLLNSSENKSVMNLYFSLFKNGNAYSPPTLLDKFDIDIYNPTEIINISLKEFKNLLDEF